MRHGCLIPHPSTFHRLPLSPSLPKRNEVNASSQLPQPSPSTSSPPLLFRPFPEHNEDSKYVSNASRLHPRCGAQGQGGMMRQGCLIVLGEGEEKEGEEGVEGEG